MFQIKFSNSCSYKLKFILVKTAKHLVFVVEVVSLMWLEEILMSIVIKFSQSCFRVLRDHVWEMSATQSGLSNKSRQAHCKPYNRAHHSGWSPLNWWQLLNDDQRRGGIQNISKGKKTRDLQLGTCCYLLVNHGTMFELLLTEMK